jgi:hypothetical protein
MSPPVIVCVSDLGWLPVVAAGRQALRRRVDCGPCETRPTTGPGCALRARR